MKGQTLELPDQAYRDALASAVAVASKLGIPREDLYVGAGTSLVMRWRHRPLTGIWIFHTPFQGDLRFTEPSQIAEAIEAEGGEDLFLDYSYCRWTLNGIEAGIYSSTPLTEPRSPQREASSGLPVETVHSAFRKKLVGRIGAAGFFVPRDGIDMMELARREPAELQRLLDEHRHMLRACSQELLLQERIDPVEELKPLWSSMATLFAEEPRAHLFEEKLPLDLLAPQPGKGRAFIDPRHAALLPDEDFASFSWKEPFDETRLGSAGPSMAGHPLSPAPEEIREWLLTEKRENLSDDAVSFMAEYFKQLDGTDLFTFRQSCGGSLRDIVRMVRWTDFMMSPAIKTGLNRLPQLLLRGSRVEEVDGYALLAAMHSPA